MRIWYCTGKFSYGGTEYSSSDDQRYNQRWCTTSIMSWSNNKYYNEGIFEGSSCHEWTATSRFSGKRMQFHGIE